MADSDLKYVIVKLVEKRGSSKSIYMQAGTMGVNSVLIYKPVKEGYDHDPPGTFIRQ